MIAITRYSATDYLATLAIDSVHPKYDVYRVQINDVNIRLKMLLNNEMDAVLLSEPQATRARLEGHVKLMAAVIRTYVWVCSLPYRGLEGTTSQAAVGSLYQGLQYGC